MSQKLLGDPAPIGPNQAFFGEVNDQDTNATIRMACFGPVHPGQTGHPMEGQTVKALPVANPTPQVVGFTGSAAHQLNVSFAISSTAASPVVLRSWAVSEKIPTTLLLPCYGTGTVTLQPVPDEPHRACRHGSGDVRRPTLTLPNNGNLVLNRGMPGIPSWA
jgi:hypothetical protein